MKTTIVGLLLAIVTALQPYLLSGEIDLSKNWIQYLLAVLLASLGYLSKDAKDIGGGGIKNPKK